MFTSSPSIKGSTAWYREMDHKLRDVVFEIKCLRFPPYRLMMTDLNKTIWFGSRYYSGCDPITEKPTVFIYHESLPVQGIQEQVAVANSKADDSSFTFIQNKN